MASTLTTLKAKSQLLRERSHENGTHCNVDTASFCKCVITRSYDVRAWSDSMMKLHELNMEARKALLRNLANTSVFASDDLALLLVANFLREISDVSHEANDYLRQISQTLKEIEMNMRLKP